MDSPTTFPAVACFAATANSSQVFGAVGTIVELKYCTTTDLLNGHIQVLPSESLRSFLTPSKKLP